MINLEQIRASQALKTAEAVEKSDVSGLPALILGNGLLAATAFVSEDGKAARAGMKHVMDGAARHLAALGIVTAEASKPHDCRMLVKSLSSCDSITLMRATAEALAFVGYVKRFAKKTQDSEKSSSHGNPSAR